MLGIEPCLLHAPFELPFNPPRLFSLIEWESSHGLGLLQLHMLYNLHFFSSPQPNILYILRSLYRTKKCGERKEK